MARCERRRNLVIDPVLYSTCLGGQRQRLRLWYDSIAVDNSGNAWIVGDTQSTNFPTMQPLHLAAISTCLFTLSPSNAVFDAFLKRNGSRAVDHAHVRGQRNRRRFDRFHHCREQFDESHIRRDRRVWSVEYPRPLFNVTPTAVSSQTQATIAATYAGSTQTPSLTVN